MAGTDGECIAAFGPVVAISFFLAVVGITSGTQWKSKETKPDVYLAVLGQKMNPS